MLRQALALVWSRCVGGVLPLGRAAVRHVGLVASMAATACGGGDDGGGGPSTSLQVIPQALNLADCEVATIAAALLDGQGSPVPGTSFTFQSTSSAVASVTPQGVVTANGVGSASIVVSTGQLKDTVAVTVAPGPLALIAVPDSINLDPGGVRALSATVTNCHGTILASPALTFTTLDPAIVSIVSGSVIGETPGLGRVEITSGAATDTATVNVYSPSHPGSVPNSASIPGGPYGIAVSGAGQVYVTRLGDARIGRDTIPVVFPVSNSIPVGQDPTDVAFAPRLMKAFVTNQGSLNVGVIDVVNHTMTTTITTSGNPFRVLSRSNNRTYITVATGWLLVVNSTTNAKLDSIAIDPTGNGLTLSADNNTAYISSTTTGRVQEIDLITRTVTDSFFIGGTPQDVALSSDESILYVANEGVGLMKLDLGSGSVTDTLLIPAFGVKLTPDGTMLVVVGGGDITLVDEASFTPGSVISFGGDIRRLAFARGGRMVVAANGGSLSVETIQ